MKKKLCQSVSRLFTLSRCYDLMIGPLAIRMANGVKSTLSHSLPDG